MQYFLNLAILFLALSSFAAPKLTASPGNCFNHSTNKKIKNYNEVFGLFASKNYSEFEKKFFEMCKKFPENLSCSAEEMSSEAATEKMKNPNLKTICTEKMAAYEYPKKGRSKLFTIDDKKEQSKK